MLPLAGHNKSDDALRHVVFDGELCVTNIGHDNNIFIEVKIVTVGRPKIKLTNTICPAWFYK